MTEHANEDELKRLFEAARSFDARGQLAMHIDGWSFRQERPGVVHLAKDELSFTGSSALMAVTIMSLDDEHWPMPV